MYASAHCVFVGPGRLPDELREVLLVRQGAPQPDLPYGPRLLAFFDTAAEAERIAGQLQRLRLKTLLAGPEQPPAEDGWLAAAGLEGFGEDWEVTLGGQQGPRALDLAQIGSVAVVEWRPPEGADRAVLLRTPALERPLFLRAHRLGDPGQPFVGLRRLNALLEACRARDATGERLRRRRLGPGDVGAPTLTGDLLPLALAMVDAVDGPWGQP